MRKYCNAHKDGIIDERVSGYIAESENYRYCIRCTPEPGEYHAYIYIYDKRQQEMFVEQGEKLNNDRQMIKRLREKYPHGTRVRLNTMRDPYSPVEPGTLGSVDYIDDIGTIHMSWDNGRTLGLVPGEDSFSFVSPPPERQHYPFKLYMPLNCDLYISDDYGGSEDEPEILDGNVAREYADNILAAMVKYRMPEERERGLMHWYGETDNGADKVHSAFFDIEERDGCLWGIVDCEVYDDFTDYELKKFKDYITGQASDGWGEGFEQQDIKVSDGILSVHLWSSGNDWQLMTEAEFSQKYEPQNEPQLDI